MEKIELANTPEKEKIVNLSELSFNFCSDSFIAEHFNKKITAIENKDLWIEKNKAKLVTHKDEVNFLIKNGLIEDDDIETIRLFKLNKYKESERKMLNIKKDLEGKVEYIKKSVANKLKIYLPQWNSPKINVIFTLNKKADFCVDKDVIVDLQRLTQEDDYLNKTINGITHEIFHVWMSEKSSWENSDIDKKTEEGIKNQIILRTIDEGLAVLIGEQSLKIHHERQGKVYTDYIQESFSAFNEHINNNKNLKESFKKNEGFNNMGHNYVVGYEICKAILEEKGIDEFRKLLPETKKDPQKMIKLYKEICSLDNKLPIVAI